jgi:hypothetical protein
VICLSDFNIDENTINKLKDMMNKGDLSNIISQIPPEMMENVSNMMGNKTSNNENASRNQSNQFDFSKIDANTILKMQSIMNKMNNSNDPRTNLLYSLKPYLRDERKGKVDQYANLLNVAKIADLLKSDDNKENNGNG